MARKNPFADLDNAPDSRNVQPVLDYAVRGATRAMASSIADLTARAEKLADGQAVVDLAPDSVDPSFVRDRIEIDDQEFEELFQAIREKGQDSPILVRPHPQAAGRFMLVFGRRRLLVAKRLGRPVRAVIKDMSDREHVIAQGQENSARANLSYIEKARFASTLVERRYDSDNGTVLAALSTDKASLSKLLSVASLPKELLDAIGPAKAVGRDRWIEFKRLLEKPSRREVALQIIAEPGFAGHPSDDRFGVLLRRLKHSMASARPKAVTKQPVWTSNEGLIAAETNARGGQFTLSVAGKGPDAVAFGNYLKENLTALYENFRQGRRPLTQTGD